MRWVGPPKISTVVKFTKSWPRKPSENSSCVVGLDLKNHLYIDWSLVVLPIVSRSPSHPSTTLSWGSSTRSTNPVEIRPGKSRIASSPNRIVGIVPSEIVTVNVEIACIILSKVNRIVMVPFIWITVLCRFVSFCVIHHAISLWARDLSMNKFPKASESKENWNSG